MGRSRSDETPAKGEPAEKTNWRTRWSPFQPRPKLDSDRRFTRRESGEGLIAFYWDGDVPRAHRVRDISMQGTFIETDFTWACGTVLVLTLQIGSIGEPYNRAPDAIVVLAEIVRTTAEGMGMKFPVRDLSHLRTLYRFLSRWKSISDQTKSDPGVTQSLDWRNGGT